MTNWLARLRDVCGKATQGPWRIEPFGCPMPQGRHWKINSNSKEEIYSTDHPHYIRPRNADHIATFNPQMVAAMLDVVEAAVKAADEIDLFYTKMEQESRKQTIWEDEHDLWFARDNIQLKLAALKKLVGGEDERMGQNSL